MRARSPRRAGADGRGLGQPGQGAAAAKEPDPGNIGSCTALGWTRSSPGARPPFGDQFDEDAARPRSQQGLRRRIGERRRRAGPRARAPGPCLGRPCQQPTAGRRRARFLRAGPVSRKCSNARVASGSRRRAERGGEPIEVDGRARRRRSCLNQVRAAAGEGVGPGDPRASRGRGSSTAATTATPFRPIPRAQSRATATPGRPNPSGPRPSAAPPQPRPAGGRATPPAPVRSTPHEVTPLEEKGSLGRQRRGSSSTNCRAPTGER